MGTFPNKAGKPKKHFKYWLLVKAEYQQTDTTIELLSQKWNLNPATVKDRAHKEGWTREIRLMQQEAAKNLKQSAIEWESKIRNISESFLTPVKNILVSSAGELEPQDLLASVRSLKTIDDISRRSHGLVDTISDGTKQNSTVQVSIVQVIEQLRSTGKELEISDELHRKLVNSNVTVTPE